MQSHRLTGPHLGNLVDILVDHHTHHRIAASDRMVWS
jgi:hypothetical protein